ncbi:hypothetical protein [Achromobacter sp. DH1f]|uniref:hypothetical protein n=1 Tax=Achromobacter sp. DH1f TaxID=1397275 RepID=UPI0012FF56CF|nr:hypothetical protein [Achromobacter sp. DH1f]
MAKQAPLSKKATMATPRSQSTGRGSVAKNSASGVFMKVKAGANAANPYWIGVDKGVKALKRAGVLTPTGKLAKLFK